MILYTFISFYNLERLQKINLDCHIFRGKGILQLHFFKFYFFITYTLLTFMSMYLICLVPEEAKTGCQIPWDWRYRELGANILLD